MDQTQTIESSGSVGIMARVSWSRVGRRLAVGLVGILLSFGVVYWGAALILGDQHKARYTWTGEIQFLFSGVTRGEYPNGMAFSASDLVSDVVLARALEMVDRPDLDLDVTALSSQLTVTSFLPRLSQLAREYEQRLSDELTQVEIEELEQAYLNELQRGVQRQAQLILTAEDPEFPGTAILEAIPRAWAEYVSEELKTFSTDRMLYSARLIDEGIFNEADFISAYNLILDQLRLLRENLLVLDAEPNSGLVRDPDSGRRLSDIRARADQLEAVYLDNLLSQVIGLGLTRNPEQTLAFIEARSSELQRRANLLNQQSKAIDEALQSYGQTTGSPDSEAGQVGSGDAFLDRLVSLGMESGDLEFRQTLTRDRLAIDLEATSIQSELRRLRGLTENVSELSAQNSLQASNNMAVVETVAAALDEIIVDIRAMFGATNGIAEQMDRLQFGDGTSLYRLNRVSQTPEEVARLFTAGSVYWFWVLTVALSLIVLAGVIGREMLDIVIRRQAVS